jgi:hypothetical protein
MGAFDYADPNGKLLNSFQISLFSYCFCLWTFVQ